MAAEAAGKPFEMFDVVAPIAEVFSHLLFEEFVMVVLTILPLFMGLVAALHVMTGVTQGPLDAEVSGDLGALGSTIHHDIEESTASVQGGMSKVDQHIAELQRGHDQRFADLHKDLAGIVWELSKLRADMARWQVRRRPIFRHRVLHRTPLPNFPALPAAA